MPCLGDLVQPQNTVFIGDLVQLQLDEALRRGDKECPTPQTI